MNPLSAGRERTAFTLFLLMTLLVVPAYAYYGFVTRPANEPWTLAGDLQLRATSVQVTGLSTSGLSFSIAVTVYNPNGFGVSLDSADYSVYADGNHLFDGQITNRFELAPQATRTLVLPVPVGWGSAFHAIGNYIWSEGYVNWEVKGKASIEVGGLPLTVPFDVSIRAS